MALEVSLHVALLCVCQHDVGHTNSPLLGSEHSRPEFSYLRLKVATHGCMREKFHETEE